MMTERCRVCEAISEPFGRATILGRHDVAYFRCGECGYVQTEEPYWLDESYSKAITSTDVGLVERNITHSNYAGYLIWLFLDHGRGRYLDFAGGYGLLTRLMRNKGFDFRHYDEHCQNLFAAGFEADPECGQGYDLVTAFELFEHLRNPVETASRLLALAPRMFFSTELLPPVCPAPGTWWYYAVEHGQHIGFFTRRSLEILAEISGRHFYSNGRNLHLFWDRGIGWRARYLFPKYRWVERFNLFFRKASLVQDDYRDALELVTRSVGDFRGSE